MKTKGKVLEKQNRLRRWFGILLIFAGLLIAASMLYPQVYARFAPSPVMNPEVVAAGSFWLVIPEINVDSVVLGEVSRHTLNQAVAHLPGSGFPGEGTNIIIVGHQYNPATAHRPQSSFGLLDSLNQGDPIYLAYQEQVYTYLVEGKETLDADDPQLYILTGHEQLTLLTCAPMFHETKRLKVTALPAQ
ncbi:sortase [Dethiobacter alkaliphilus]|uniref:sortase n=1 Tax=Dethiobacter alkaliphilus TaxID=427926 RepID=UPI002226C1F3|nr:sortase [Dethiobacter alkaliphilus]MCW3489383.1 sortase [Dethiobacter alkaliphilus]